MKFQCLYVDPPWRYEDHRTSASMGMAESAYATLSLDDLKSLAPLIDKVSAKDCLLFLWGTWPKLPDALELINSWGFVYRTVGFLWLKTNPTWKGPNVEPRDVYSGLGHYTNGNTEFVLLAKRGHPCRQKLNVKQVVIAARSSHSKKPDDVRTRIEALVGDVPKLELFGRDNHDNWITVGNEIDGLDIREALDNIVKTV